jgi:3-phytase
MSIAPNTSFQALGPIPFGGISGIVYDREHGELLGVSDERIGRVFRMRVQSDPLWVEPIGVIRLDESGDAPPELDAEAIARLPDGHLLIASEGVGHREPRLPPAIIEYDAHGRFVRQLPVPAKFIPAARGPLTAGMRENEAFESLTLTPDARQLFTGSESALVQDADRASFEHGAPSRIIEYERRGNSYAPSREMAYEVDAIPKVSFEPGESINGLVELLALSDRDLLALERSYVADPARPGYGANSIRLYRISLDHATDISSLASLRGRHITPVAKTLIVDLGSIPGLPAELSTLDNFEGLALLPAATGPPSLLMVSDDNFSPTERTWLVRLAFMGNRMKR